MGLFAKKTYICRKCGKEFEKRINFNGDICNECRREEKKEFEKLVTPVLGYIDYGYKVLIDKNYSDDELREITKHRDNILDKYKQTNGISRLELQTISDNYKKMSEEEINQAISRMLNSMMFSTMGAYYTSNFFAITQHKNVIVDAKDVFAVAYTSDYKTDSGLKTESILCAVFTNDPYIPVFPMLYLGEIGFFELSKSKKGRESMKVLFGSMCPNLTYPVSDLKQLRKTIKKEKIVRGSIDEKLMLHQISNALNSSGIFNTKKMHNGLHESSANMLEQAGYIQDDEISKILKMDKMFNRNFWNKQLKRI